MSPVKRTDIRSCQKNIATHMAAIYHMHMWMETGSTTISIRTRIEIGAIPLELDICLFSCSRYQDDLFYFNGISFFAAPLLDAVNHAFGRMQRHVFPLCFDIGSSKGATNMKSYPILGKKIKIKIINCSKYYYYLLNN